MSIIKVFYSLKVNIDYIANICYHNNMGDGLMNVIINNYDGLIIGNIIASNSINMENMMYSSLNYFYLNELEINVLEKTTFKDIKY